jgi:arabinogalactan endo-1,4-beta-galactosidase
MESTGKKFYNSAGIKKECMQLMKDPDNAIRLRVWVTPQKMQQLS